jgi:hypothetical protein
MWFNSISFNNTNQLALMDRSWNWHMSFFGQGFKLFFNVGGGLTGFAWLRRKLVKVRWSFNSFSFIVYSIAFWCENKSLTWLLWFYRCRFSILKDLLILYQLTICSLTELYNRVRFASAAFASLFLGYKNYINALYFWPDEPVFGVFDFVLISEAAKLVEVRTIG